MVKLFVTGDNHIGRKFDKYPIKDILVESRFKSLQNMVKKAEEEKCEFFVVTGDLFDNTYAIAKRDIKRVVEILSKFNQTVLVLPGNHDFYSGNESVWDVFCNEADVSGNIILLNKYEKREFDGATDSIVVYPAYCDSKHSESNRIGWIKNEEIDQNKFNIGIAHGALEGLAIDTEGKYFPMTKTELHGIPLDVWLIGHAHVTEPTIPANEEVTGYNIFNAGTHEQLDLHNNTEGNAFVITLDNSKGIKQIIAKRVKTGEIRYYDTAIEVDSVDGKGLEDTIQETIKGYSSRSIVRLTVSGSVSATEFQRKENIYEDNLERFLNYKIVDNNLSEVITKEKIEEEFSEIGFAAKFLENLMDEPVELQMAYDVIKSLQ